MLALRDQENLVHAHQTVAAGKPLNQGTKQLQPKTPFKVPLNDENGPLAMGKKTVKGGGKQNENMKPGKDAFVTPSGRYPLSWWQEYGLELGLTKKQQTPVNVHPWG